jgi:hypothetical protein
MEKIKTYFMLHTILNIVPFMRQFSGKWQSQKFQRNNQQFKPDMAPHRNDSCASQLRQEINVQYALQAYRWKTRNYARMNIHDIFSHTVNIY